MSTLITVTQIAFTQTILQSQRIETTISQSVALTPHSIHAVTAKGFLIKVLLFIFAYQLKSFIQTRKLELFITTPKLILASNSR